MYSLYWQNRSSSWVLVYFWFVICCVGADVLEMGAVYAGRSVVVISMFCSAVWRSSYLRS